MYVNLVLINGNPQSTVSALDRGLLYGDSLFETVAFYNGKSFLLEDHLKRLKIGVERLLFNVDFELLRHEIDRFISQVKTLIGHNKRAIIRITLTRGEYSRGYKPSPDCISTRVLSLHEWPKNINNKPLRIALSDIRYSYQPVLAGIKHGNRLEQVLASQSIPSDADDVIMLNHHGSIISCSKGNLFVKIENKWITPALTECGIEGVVRNQVIAHFLQTKNAVKIDDIKLENIKKSTLQSAFMCNSIIGISPINELLSISISSEQECNKLRESLIKKEVIAI